MPEKENNKDNGFVSRMFLLTIKLRAISNRLGIHADYIAAHVIRHGGADRGFGPDDANLLIEATKQVDRSEKADKN